MKIFKGKEMVAYGRLTYQAPSQLRCDYISPDNFAFIMNDGRAKIVKNSSTVQEFKGPEAKVFKDLSRVMMSLLDRAIKQGKKNVTTIITVPKDMRHLYSKIVLYHNKQTGFIEKVVMQEVEGDYTEIELKNVRTNIKMDSEIFK